MATVKKRRQEKKIKDNTRTQTDKASAGENDNSLRQEFEDAIKDFSERQANEEKSNSLESAEIVVMVTGRLSIVINRGLDGTEWVELDKTKGDALSLNYVHEKIEQACAERKIDIVSNSNLKKLAKKAFLDYIKEKQKRDRKAAKEAERAQQEGPPIELTPELTREITFEDVAKILETTIKRDRPPKLITFCGMLNAQTEDDQLNVGYQEQSSAGKSYIALEVSVYFPKWEVMALGGATPTAFTYETGEWDEDKKAVIVDLEGKILIFIDMPDYRLLQKLRPILSHDKKEIQYKSTDKSERHGLRTKTAIVRGFPSVFFCTTSADVDEQESTRLILISPSTAQEKIDEALQLLALRKGNWDKYQKEVLEDPKRAWLSNRIKAIRQTRVRHIILPQDGKGLYQEFKDTHAYLQPRHQRDFPRIISLIKAHALLNVFNRQRITEIAVVATEEDIKAGLELYKEIESSNELGLSPYAYEIYDKAIKPILDPNEPITRKDIRQQFFKAFRRTIAEKQESSILSQLEAAGLILQEPDPKDRRRTLIFYPTHRAGIFSESDTSTDPKKSAEGGAAMTKEILEKYIRQMCGVSEEKAREILASFGNRKKEENEEGSWKNVKAHDAAGGNDPDHSTTTPHTERIHHDDVVLCRICGWDLRSEQALTDHMASIHSVFREGTDS